MKDNIMKSLFLSALLVVLPIVSSVTAQTIDTVITGTVFDGGGNEVNGAAVTVVCDGNVRNTTTNSSGDYLVTYPSSECVQGDTATASATAPEGSGSNTGTVERFTAGSGLELDIAIINITLAVPEFGAIGGVLTAIGSGLTFLGLKRKFLQ